MKNKKPVLQYVILISSALLLILNIFSFDFQNEKTVSFLLRIGSNVLVIIAMILAIREINKKRIA
jgi:uncharacterized integral membrane protein